MILCFKLQKGFKHQKKHLNSIINVSIRFFQPCCHYLDPKHLHMEALNGHETCWGSDKSGISNHPYVNRHLEVVLLLADKGFISCGVAEALISVYMVTWRWSTQKKGCKMSTNNTVMITWASMQFYANIFPELISQLNKWLTHHLLAVKNLIFKV